MRFTRSECPDCTKEVLMTHELTHVYAKKRDASHMTALQVLQVQIARASRASFYVYFVWRPPLRLRGAAGRQRAGRDQSAWLRQSQ